jgi:hypothetical protein
MINPTRGIMEIRKKRIYCPTVIGALSSFMPPGIPPGTPPEAYMPGC